MSLISYVKTATNKRLLISESYADSNQCTPCRGNLTSMPHAFHAQPAYGPDCMYLIWSVHSNLSLANDRAGSSSTRVGEQCDHGGGPVRGNGRCAGPRKKKKKKKMGPALGNNATFELIQKFKLTRLDLIKRRLSRIQKISNKIWL
jgi:hypothetical protein